MVQPPQALQATPASWPKGLRSRRGSVSKGIGLEGGRQQRARRTLRPRSLQRRRRDSLPQGLAAWKELRPQRSFGHEGCFASEEAYRQCKDLISEGAAVAS